MNISDFLNSEHPHRMLEDLFWKRDFSPREVEGLAEVENALFTAASEAESDANIEMRKSGTVSAAAKARLAAAGVRRELFSAALDRVRTIQRTRPIAIVFDASLDASLGVSAMGKLSVEARYRIENMGRWTILPLREAQELGIAHRPIAGWGGNTEWTTCPSTINRFMLHNRAVEIQTIVKRSATVRLDWTSLNVIEITLPGGRSEIFDHNGYASPRHSREAAAIFSGLFGNPPQ